MPLLGLAALLVSIGFAFHAHRTGRQNWVFIVLLLPVAGSLAYIVAELLPELAQTRRARQVAADIGTVIDPDRSYRERLHQVQLTGSAEAKRQLALECEARGMWRDATALYASAASGPFENDEALLVGLARARLGADDADGAQHALGRLAAAHGALKGHEARLLEARTREAQGRLDEARALYAALAPVYPGPEAQTRYALMLQKTGDVAAARALFADVVSRGRAAAKFLSRDEKEWVEVARRNVESRI